MLNVIYLCDMWLYSCNVNLYVNDQCLLLRDSVDTSVLVQSTKDMQEDEELFRGD